MLSQRGPEPDFARQLGNWVNVAAASQLFGALQASPGGAPAATSTVADTGCLVQARAARQAALAKVEDSFLPQARRSRLGFPQLVHPLPEDPTQAYPPFRLFHSAHQREMQHGAQRWRERLRGALRAGTAEQRQLARLDDGIDQVLDERGTALRIRQPEALARHFEGLRSAAQQAGDASDRWFDQFAHDLRAVLLAEVDLVWQPLVGLMSALTEPVSLTV